MLEQEWGFGFLGWPSAFWVRGLGTAVWGSWSKDATAHCSGAIRACPEAGGQPGTVIIRIGFWSIGNY